MQNSGATEQNFTLGRASRSTWVARRRWKHKTRRGKEKLDDSVSRKLRRFPFSSDLGNGAKRWKLCVHKEKRVNDIWRTNSIGRPRAVGRPVVRQYLPCPDVCRVLAAISPLKTASEQRSLTCLTCYENINVPKVFLAAAFDVFLEVVHRPSRNSSPKGWQPLGPRFIEPFNPQQESKKLNFT